MMKGISNRILRALHVARVLLFLLGITIPLMGFCFGWQGSAPLNSKGEPVEFPEWSSDPFQWGNFILGFRAYFNERFGFRDKLIQLHARINIQGFGVASNDKVVLGKEGWLFLGKAQDSIEYSRHVHPFTDEQLEGWKTILETRRDYLKAKGIEYVFVVVPNKETIYPEFLPDWYNRVHPQSRLDQFMAYLGEHSDLKVVDLRSSLLAAKGVIPLYYKTDSHWTSFGASVGYQTLMNSIAEWFPAVQPLAVTDFGIQRRANEFRGDLLDLSGIGDQVFEDEIVVVPRLPRRSRRGTLRENEQGNNSTMMTECEGADLPRAVIFHDSFFGELQPFVSEHFQRALYVWQPNFETRFIDRDTCDIVIHETAERHLVWWPPPEDVFDETIPVTTK